MLKNTALRAEKSKEKKLLLRIRNMRNFYYTYLSKCRYPDYCYYVEWEAMFYAEN